MNDKQQQELRKLQNDNDVLRAALVKLVRQKELHQFSETAWQEAKAALNLTGRPT